jgi:glycosyltransferase involved in cell wall biosynthesis
MRILHVEKFLPGAGGVGSCIRRLSDLQRRRGHEVFQFGCVGPDGPVEMPRYFDFTATRNPLSLPRMIHNDEAAEKLQRLLRRQRIDVAHLHNIYHHLTPSILPVLARRGIGIVMTVHDYRLACPTKLLLRPCGVCERCVPNKYYHAASPRCAGMGGAGLAIESYLQRFLRRYFRWVDFFICPSRHMREVLLRTGLPRSKGVVLPNPIEPLDLTESTGEENSLLPRPAPGRQELLYAGRLIPEKGPELMLELAGRCPDVSVVVAGGGVMLEDLRREVVRRGLANVTLTGDISHDRLGGLYARATAVVVTSRWIENSPQVMLEAMAAGRCVIAPDHPPLREWVQDGRTGRLFAPADPDDLARVAREVLADPRARASMSQAARELVTARHDDRTIMEATEALYRKAIRRCALRW